MQLLQHNDGTVDHVPGNRIVEVLGSKLSIVHGILQMCDTVTFRQPHLHGALHGAVLCDIREGACFAGGAILTIQATVLTTTRQVHVEATFVVKVGLVQIHPGWCNPEHHRFRPALELDAHLDSCSIAAFKYRICTPPASQAGHKQPMARRCVRAHGCPNLPWRSWPQSPRPPRLHISHCLKVQRRRHHLVLCGLKERLLQPRHRLAEHVSRAGLVWLTGLFPCRGADDGPEWRLQEGQQCIRKVALALQEDDLSITTPNECGIHLGTLNAD
mmetsp:Transcript_32965/g.74761  ORF Transcript_32965/g.74761 Transcript_32965/m.74761 type:complete len:272 (-) Transcript_32965:12-827(-)